LILGCSNGKVVGFEVAQGSVVYLDIVIEHATGKTSTVRMDSTSLAKVDLNKLMGYECAVMLELPDGAFL